MSVSGRAFSTVGMSRDDKRIDTAVNYKGGKLMLADRQEICLLGFTECLAYNLLYLSHFVSDFGAERALW